MRRREFVVGMIGAAAWPLVVRAQQSGMPVVGFLRSTPLAEVTHLLTAVRQGLEETGFIEGQNVTVKYWSAENDPDKLPVLVADLVRGPVSVIVGDNISAIAAKAATITVPIVFTTAGDPVRQGLVANLNRPGGNLTGVSFFGGLLGAKRLDLLRQIVPQATTIAMLVNPNTPTTEVERIDVQAAAHAIGQQLVVSNVRSDRDIETAFATFVQRGAGALLTGSGAFLNSNRQRIVALAAHHQLPASYVWREAVLAGGLMSYGPSITDAHRQAGIYAGRIIKGEKPGDLPVLRSTKFELVINLETAKALGVTNFPSLLAAADEVIE